MPQQEWEGTRYGRFRLFMTRHDGGANNYEDRNSVVFQRRDEMGKSNDWRRIVRLLRMYEIVILMSEWQKESDAL